MNRQLLIHIYKKNIQDVVDQGKQAMNFVVNKGDKIICCHAYDGVAGLVPLL